MTTLKDEIMAALSSVKHGSADIVSSGMVSSLQISPSGEAVFALEVDPAMGASMEPLRQEAEKVAASVKGVSSATAILTAQRVKDDGPDPHGMNKNPRLLLPFKHVIAVASGKGGVGKSTVAFNLAVEMARAGLSVALLDADIYGPSVPRLSGLGMVKPSMNEAGKLVPLEAHGLRLMSMGFLVEEEKAMIWRGPMVQTAFYQMLRDVAWSADGKDLDVLVIDMPPGTGDVQLTLAQKVPVSGAVIVSTPQDLALIDARKAVAMFEKTGVPILGVVENMSYYCCSNCGHTENIFGHGGARAEAEKQGVAFLGEIPLDPQIRQQADAGEQAKHPAYAGIVKRLLSVLK